MREQVDLLKLFLEIYEAIRRIERRFNGIKEPDDFIRDIDAEQMRLKGNYDRTERLEPEQADIDATEIRDIIAEYNN